MNIKVTIRSMLRWMAANPFCSAILNSYFLRAARSYREEVYRRLPEGEPPPTELVEKLRKEAIVRHGPFAGTRYPTSLQPSMFIQHSKFLGTYESALHEAIETAIKRQPDVVVDIGCAEGYYVVGLARRMPKAQIIAFDIDPGAQALCRKMALANNVSDQVVIEGECTYDRLKAILSKARRPLIIADCEGYEVKLFAPGSAAIFASADVLVELHDYVHPHIPVKVSLEFTNTHKVTLLQSLDDFARPFNDQTPELSGLGYGQKYHLLAETRKSVMTWGWYQSKVERS